MSPHFYYNGHTYEIEVAPLTWSAARDNATSLSWSNEGTTALTIAAGLTQINSLVENASIVKNFTKSLLANAPLATDGGSLPYFWTGATDGSENWSIGSTGSTRSDLASTNQLWSVIEWAGLIGTPGNDKLRTANGNDTIIGNSGDDKITTGSGNNFIAGDDGIDTIKTGNGNNTVVGGLGDDRITTGSGNDIIDADGHYADAGDAAAGNDIIRAGAGNDTIHLGDGVDAVWSGSGNDTLVLSIIPDSSPASLTGTLPLVHTIRDFDAGRPGAIVDKLSFDTGEFASLAGFTATNLIKGIGVVQASQNETGIDDYLILNTSNGALYYDADGNESESEPVLIAVLRGKLGSFSHENIVVF